MARQEKKIKKAIIVIVNIIATIVMVLGLTILTVAILKAIGLL